MVDWESTYKKVQDAGWKQDTNGWKYKTNDGSYIKASAAYLGGEWYLFGEDSYMKTGWQERKGARYYYDFKNGVMQPGWVKIEGAWYYFDEYGVYSRGETIPSRNYQEGTGPWAFERSTWCKVNGRWYYFDFNGDPVSGWKKWEEQWYFLNTTSSGGVHMGEMKSNEWYQEGDSWYWLKEDGAMACAESLVIEKVSYRFDASGAWIP